MNKLLIIPFFLILSISIMGRTKTDKVDRKIKRSSVINDENKIRIGRVDVQSIISSVKEGQRVEKILKKSFMKKQKILKDDEIKARKMQSDFEKQNLVMNDKSKEKTLAKIQNSIIELRQKKVKFQTEIEGMERSLKEPIFEKIKIMINEISKKKKIDLTFEKMSSGILYSRKSIDLTKMVIDLYNKRYK